jgi:GntR family transcriptional regulator / MocR family aminotransferase
MTGRVAPMNRSILELDHTSAVPLYRQIYERLRRAVLDGQLKAGERLPSTRELASELGVSRNTVFLAYEQLLAEGYIEGKVGSGTTIASSLPETFLHAKTGQRTGAPLQKASVRPALSRCAETLLQAPFLQRMPYPAGDGAGLAFRTGIPTFEAFPHKIWTQLITRYTQPSRHDLFTYQLSEGYRPLREAIATHVGLTRGVRCTADQVIIVAGSQGGLDLVARVLLNPGDAAWIEDPGYPGARGVLLGAGAQVVPVPVDNEGLDVAAGIKRDKPARLAFVTPSHQFPLGETMSLSRRLALLEWAKGTNAWIIEDDYDSEYRFAGRPLASLQSLDSANRVIYLGTFSKVLFPALRLGYLVVPPELVDAFIAVRRFIDMHAPILEQGALADFIAEGHFSRHIRRTRNLYAARRAALVEALQQELGSVLEIQGSEAGMHLVGRLPTGVDDRAVARQLRSIGIDVTAISAFSMEPVSRGGLLLGYAPVAEQAIREGVLKLAAVLHTMNVDVK